MKKILIIILLILGVSNIYAQNKRVEYSLEGNTFKMITKKSKVTLTPYFWTDREGKTYPIYKTDKSCFIIKKSKKTGKEYRYYLPKEVQQKIINSL